jgi:hypothetical protein
MDPSPINWADKAVELTAAAIFTLMSIIMTIMSRANGKMANRIETMEEKGHDHEARIQVSDAKFDAMKTTLGEIKKDVKANNAKLDQLISRGS